jgi:hypothetical protein
MSTRFVKHIISFHSVPLYAIVLASLISTGLLMMHMLGMDLWKMALLILLAWLPICVVNTAGWLSFLSC